MTSEPRPSDHLPQDAGPPASGDDLDQAFADVEQEVGIQPTPSGEPGQADADVFADLDIDDADDVFVIDDEELTGAPAAADAPAAEPVAAAAQQPAPQASDFGDELSVRPDDGASEPEEPEPSSLEDALFAPPKAIEPSERFGEEPTFREDGGHTWGGGDLSHEEIGIAAREGDDQSPHLLEEDDAPWVPPGEELEIVGDDGDRLDDDLDSGYPDAEADAAEQFGQPAHAGAELGIEPVEETDYTAPASGVWGGAESTLRPAAEADDFASAEDAYGDDQPAEEEDTYDPIYGAEATAAASEQDVEPEEPDYSEYEEAYVEHTAEAPVVVGAPAAPRRRRVLAFAAAAAVLVVGVGAGVAFMRPDWLGLGTAPPLIDRAQIARPMIALDLPEPPPPAGGPAVPETTPETVPVAKEPEAVPTPAEPQPEPEKQPEPEPDTPAVVAKEPPAGERTAEPTEPTEPTPKVEDPPVVAVEPTDLPTSAEPTAVPPEGDLIKIGEELQVGRAAPMPARPRVHHLAEGISTGSQAFAQLKNMNFFLGRVKAMDSSYLTLDLAPGEVTLAFDDLNAIVPLASEEYRMMQGSAEGFVRLTNSNKLFGKILNSSLTDNVVLEVQQNHVVIPRSSIEEVGQQTRSSVQVLEDEDSAWIRTLLQRQAAPKPAPGPTPPPSGR